MKLVATGIHRIPKWILFLLGIVVAGLGLLWLFLLYMDAPKYLELNIPTFKGAVDGGYIERSTLVWSNQYSGRYYLWRQESTCSVAECVSWGNIANYYDQWLTIQGWSKSTYDSDHPCSIVAPESKGLKLEVGGYVVYRPKGRIRDWDPIPVVCLVVQPSADDPTKFEIVVGTQNPSPLTVLIKQLSQL